MLLASNGKVIVKTRFNKYFNTVNLDEIQREVFKEKREQEKKKKSHKIQLANKEFSNYLAMSGVKLKATEFLCSWVLFTILPMLLVFLLLKNVIPVLGIGIICFSIPPFLVKRSRSKRQEEFNKQLGESLVIMRNCVKSGFSFQQAMESIATEMQPPISTEFTKTLREVRFGLSLEDALNHMVDRVKNKDLDLLVSAVLTSSQVGGNLSDILEVIAETVKDRLKIKAEVRVLTSSGRISGIIIGLLPVIIIVVLMLLNPDYFQSFFETQIGKIMLIISVVLEVVGFAVINKVVDIKY
jgi:tight adherence protein B